jgi:hypothetical protein
VAVARRTSTTDPPGTFDTATAVAASIRSERQRSGTAMTAARCGWSTKICRVTRTPEVYMS